MTCKGGLIWKRHTAYYITLVKSTLILVEKIIIVTIGLFDRLGKSSVNGT